MSFQNCLSVFGVCRSYSVTEFIYVVGSKSFWSDQLFKVTEIKQLCYFSTSSPFISTHFSTGTLTSPYMALYIPHSIFHLAQFCMPGRKLLDPTAYLREIATFVPITQFPLHIVCSSCDSVMFRPKSFTVSLRGSMFHLCRCYAPRILTYFRGRFLTQPNKFKKKNVFL